MSHSTQFVPAIILAVASGPPCTAGASDPELPNAERGTRNAERLTIAYAGPLHIYVAGPQPAKRLLTLPVN